MIIKELKEENARLKDEISSLWLILDEMAASDIEHYKNLMDELIREKTAQMLMTTTKKAEA